MATRKEPADEELARLVRESLAEAGQHDADVLTERVMDVLRPRIGAAAERRRNEGALRDSFREGFMMGKQSNRFHPWHSAIWRASQTFAALRRLAEGSPQAREASQRYSQFNF